MENTSSEKVGNKWLGIPIVAMFTRLLCRELTLQNEYLKSENRILKSKLKKRISFTDEERRTLVDAALAMGKDLMKDVVTIVKPEYWDCLKGLTGFHLKEKLHGARLSRI